MNHIRQIAEKLPEFGLDAMLVTSEPGEFYALGFHGEGLLLVTAQEAWYSTDSRYIEAAQNQITGAHVRQAANSRDHRRMVAELIEKLKLDKVGFESGYMSVDALSAYQQALSCTLVPAQKLISGLRAVKDGEEQAVMARAQEITDQVFADILDFLRPGVTEREIAARLVYGMMRLGASKPSFDPIVAAGSNGSMPHAVPGDRAVEKGMFVTMDFGCLYGGYCSDMTRTVAVGEPTEEMRRVYETVRAAQLAGIAAARAGIPGSQVDKAARDIIVQAGYGDYFGHSLGHSLGLEIHESPNFSSSETNLMPVGGVLSVEPGIYLPGRFGVRIEDVVVLQEEGCRVLTRSPKELMVL